MKNIQRSISNSELESLPQPTVSQVRTESLPQPTVSQTKMVSNVVGRTYLKMTSQINLVEIGLVFFVSNLLHATAKNLKRSAKLNILRNKVEFAAKSERGDVPGWVLVVLMTTGLVTGIWTVAQPRLSSILKNSLDNMNSIR
jgi:hypothetical protein